MNTKDMFPALVPGALEPVTNADLVKGLDGPWQVFAKALDQAIAAEPSFESFPRGFVALSEVLKIEPRDPGRRKDSSTVYRLPPNTHTPFVNRNEANELFYDHAYSYKMYCYTPSPEGDATSFKTDPDPQETFVHIRTGRGSGASVEGNIFIRFKDLEVRLASGSDSRSSKYRLDWFTALAAGHSSASYMEEMRERIGKFMPQEFRDKEWQGQDELWEYLFNQGSKTYFPMWKADGTLLTFRETAKVLADSLLSLIGADLDPKKLNLPQHIFREFCRYAYLGATREKEPWSVFARFWNHPIRNPDGHLQQFSMFYELPNWDPKSDKAYSTWKEIVEAQHREVVSDLTAKPGKRDNFLPAKDPVILAPGSDLKDLRLVGQHPQGFYRAYVMKGTYTAMQEHGFSTFSDPAPLDLYPNQQAVGLVNGWMPPRPLGDLVTRTSFTNSNVVVAATWPRWCTQKAVMNNRSANEVAEKMKEEGYNFVGSFEWLHRSAYSFGPLIPSGPGGDVTQNNAQDARNLVFGTAEANTYMIRYEQYLKHMVDIYGGAVVELDTEVLWDRHGNPQWNADENYWLSSGLSYRWKLGFPVGDGLRWTQENPFTFQLFRRCRPTLFEAKLDKGVEEALGELLGSDQTKEVAREIWKRLFGVEIF